MRDLEREQSDPDAVRREIELLRSSTPEENLRMVFHLRRVSMELCRAGIRHDRPDWTEDQVERELQRRILPPDVFEHLYPEPRP